MGEVGMDAERVGLVADEIVRYLGSHPNAADTLEGIRRWWLAQIRYDEARNIVQRALDRLVADGSVLPEATADGGTLYRRGNRARPA